MKNKDFEKARKDKLIGGLVGIFFSIMLFGITYSLYIEEVYALDLFFGVMGVGLFIVSFMGIIEYIESGCNPKEYILCKRCKCLTKKDRIFCSDCKQSIKLSIKRENDKKYFSEYKILIKQEEKKNETRRI